MNEHAEHVTKEHAQQHVGNTNTMRMGLKAWLKRKHNSKNSHNEPLRHEFAASQNMFLCALRRQATGRHNTLSPRIRCDKFQISGTNQREHSRLTQQRSVRLTSCTGGQLDKAGASRRLLETHRMGNGSTRLNFSSHVRPTLLCVLAQRLTKQAVWQHKYIYIYIYVYVHGMFQIMLLS